MSHKTGVFFQLARGRAMVRNRCMRKARYWKNRLRTQTLGVAFSPIDPQVAHDNMVWCVKRAREAHRDWRRYRQLSNEYTDRYGIG